MEECSICLNVFHEPKGLPCYHTFCLECLEIYINSNAGDKSFSCPLCRTEIKPLNPDKDKKEWARLFPTNRYILNKKEVSVPVLNPTNPEKPGAGEQADPQPLKFKKNITLSRDLYAGVNDMVMLNDQTFIITDPCFKKVWKFSNSGVYLQDISFDKEPFGLCLLENSFLAVSLPFDKKIYILNYENLTVGDTLSFDKSYSGLGSNDRNRIFALYRGENIFVDIISRSNPQSSYEISCTIKLPFYFCGTHRLRVLPSGHVLIMNYKKVWKLFCVNEKGEEVFSYEGNGDNKLKSTSDVAVDTHFIYVVDKTTNTIHRIQHGGVFVDIPLTANEISYKPNNVCVNDEGVLAMFSKEKQDYKIRIFQV